MGVGRTHGAKVYIPVGWANPVVYGDMAVSHQSRNLRRKIEREWAVRRMIKKRQSFDWPAMNLRVKFAGSGPTVFL